MGVTVDAKTERAVDLSILWFSMGYTVTGFNSAIVYEKTGTNYTQVSSGLIINGSFQGVSGTVSITGLTPNTTYKVDVLLNATTSSGATTVSDSSSDFTTDSSSAVCFLGDAPVLTSRGYRPIREFRVGDTVLTAAGREVTVKRVFRREYGPSASTNPYVIPKGILSATRPIAISPNHEVLTPNGMVKARDLGLRRMKMAGDFTYYNLELEDWVQDNLVVAGVVVESLAPAERITMSKPEFARFVATRYGHAAAARLQRVCFEERDGSVNLPALK